MRILRGVALAITLFSARAEAEEPRFRWAAHLAAGPWFVPDRIGGASGIGVQLGAQLNERVGVFYSGTAATGFASGYDRAGVDASFGVWFYNSVMADLTFDRLFQVGLGPSIDTLAFGTARATTSAATVSALRGTYVGAQTRIGFLFLNRHETGKAGHLMLGLEVHPTFGDDVMTSTMVTFGGGFF